MRPMNTRIINKTAANKRRRNVSRTIRLLEAAGYRGVRTGDDLGFHVVGVSQSGVVLIHVATSGAEDEAGISKLAAFKTAPNVQKLVHRWSDEWVPITQEL
jgi:hypothetical protein